MIKNLKLTTCLLVASVFVGCDEDDSRVAREAADRQAEQNRVMAQLHETIAEATRQLIDADGQSRQEFLGAQRELNSERSRLQQLWDQLIEQQRGESLLVSIVPTAGLVAAVSLLLGFCWVALVRTYSTEVSSEELNELLVSELTGDEPRLQLDRSQPPALTAGAEQTESAG